MCVTSHPLLRLNHTLPTPPSHMGYRASGHMRTAPPTPNINHLHLIPALTGGPPPSDLECALFDLPARLGDLGITIPSENADAEYQSSIFVSSALHDHNLLQDAIYDYDIINEQLASKATVRRQNKEKSAEKADNITKRLSGSQLRSVELAKEKGSSSWLTALPLEEHGFSLHKGAFHDALAL